MTWEHVIRQVLLFTSGMMIGMGVWNMVADRTPPAPMPEPTPAPIKTIADAIQTHRLEVLNPATGKVGVVIYVENGVPMAMIDDHGKARKVDLTALARWN